MDVTFHCVRCGRRVPALGASWRCACGGPFELAERPPFSPAAIEGELHTLWRYRAMLPLPDSARPRSLGEGFTPLVPLDIDGRRIVCKLEFLAPTGSFKDRGTSVLTSALSAWGLTDVVEDSSGNAAASLAAYCALVGIRARIFVPAYASGPKLAQIRAYGAELVPVQGPREHAARAAQQASEGRYYASHAYHPLHLEGNKTFAYELWEQLRGRAPEAIVFPAGHGTFLLGTYRGYGDLKRAELIERLPRLVAVQSEACAPLFEAFRSGAEDVSSDMTQGETIAEGIRIVRPPRAPDVLRAIRDTGGDVLIVADEEIRRAQRALAHRGLYIEPTSAAAVAGVQKLGRIAGTTVVPLTGSGLKAAGEA